MSPGKAPPEEATEPVTPDAANTSIGVNGSAKVKSVRTPAPEPIIKTPSVVGFFSKIDKQKRLESMQKELQALDATPKRNKRKEITEITVEDSSSPGLKKSRAEVEQQEKTSAASSHTSASDTLQATIDAVATSTTPSTQTAAASTPQSLSTASSTPVKSEKKARRINLITLMKPKE